MTRFHDYSFGKQYGSADGKQVGRQVYESVGAYVGRWGWVGRYR